MINEITINFNNAIDLSRGELLTWVNDLLNTNLTKIEQLGTGAIYCQLIDVLYPGKIQLSKVNWKAKYDYEFVSNFKILQQSFTKLGIMRNIEV
jgi:RP/EB family microtubule-associated protein